MGNVASIENMLKRIGGCTAIITFDPELIKQVDKIILLGVGTFDYGMSNLHSLGITEALLEKLTEQKTPLLGICLGMQLLTQGSEEGVLLVLSLIKAHTKKFASEWEGKKLTVPHMGWDYICPRKDKQLFKNFPSDMRFYFVHAYYVECEDKMTC